MATFPVRRPFAITCDIVPPMESSLAEWSGRKSVGASLAAGPLHADEIMCAWVPYFYPISASGQNTIARDALPLPATARGRDARASTMISIRRQAAI